MSEIFGSLFKYKGIFLYLLLMMSVLLCLSHGTQDLYPDFLKSIPGIAAQSILGMKALYGIAILYNIGAILGALFFGQLSQKIGRRNAIMLALVIALPILAFLGAVAALYGGGLVAWLYGGVDPEAFLLRLRDAISIDHFTVGMIKAPVMAAVIGIVACVEGLAVEGSAESLGQHTTSSVVKGIFFVIVMDGVFAIFFASIGM